MQKRPQFARALVLAAMTLSAQTSRPTSSLAEQQEGAVVLVRARFPGRQYCGTESLFLCLHETGFTQVSLRELESAVLIGPRGLRGDELVELARKVGATVSPVKTSLKKLQEWTTPAVLHVNGTHYVAFLGRGRTQNRLLLYDSSIGVVECTEEWFWNRYHWDGAAFLVGEPPPIWLRCIGSPWLCLLLVVALLVYGIVVSRKQRRSRDLNGTAASTNAQVNGVADVSGL